MVTIVVETEKLIVLFTGGAMITPIAAYDKGHGIVFEDKNLSLESGEYISKFYRKLDVAYPGRTKALKLDSNKFRGICGPVVVTTL